MQENTDTPGSDLSFEASGSNFDCCLKSCRDNMECKAFMFQVSSGSCTLKNAEFTPEQYVTNVGLTSANILCFQGKFANLVTTRE